MILFLEDWDRYPSAIVDTKTTNQSFLKLAQLYKQEFGVRNHAFMLSLLNPSLQGVDPFDPTLDVETMTAIAVECRWNPWYALREVIRLPPHGGPNPIPFKANRGNIAMAWSFFNHIDFFLIQPRQTHKSGSVNCIWVMVLFLMCDFTAIQLLTAEEKNRKEEIDRIKGIRNELPAYLNPTTMKDANNQMEVTCKARHNRYRAAIGRKDRAAAQNIGRGTSSQIFHGDEVPWIPNGHISVRVALSSGTAAREIAKENGGVYANLFTTTSGMRDTREGKFAYDLLSSGWYWNESIYDAQNVEHASAIMVSNSASEKPLVNGTFNHRQLGYTDQWMRDTLNNAKVDKDTADRDYFNLWTIGSEDHPLSKDVLERIHGSEMDPHFVERTRRNYEIRWYIPRHAILEQMRDHWHILSLDTSNVIGSDANGLTITDTRNLAVIGTSSVSESLLPKYGHWIFELMMKFPKTVLVIENKSSGQSIIDTLIMLLPQHGQDPFKRIYNRIVENPVQFEDFMEDVKAPLVSRSEVFYEKTKKYFGFDTTGSTRPYLYNTVLQQAAKTAGHLVRDKRLAKELKGLVKKNGRVDHGPGGHDDQVISWLLMHYFLAHSRNIAYYGIDMRECMSDVVEDGAILSAEEAQRRGQKKQLLLLLETLKEQLKTATGTAETYRLESMVRKHVRELDAIGGAEFLTVESILEEAREHKTKRKTLREQLNRRRAA